jgi:hypothetical protein
MQRAHLNAWALIVWALIPSSALAGYCRIDLLKDARIEVSPEQRDLPAEQIGDLYCARVARFLSMTSDQYTINLGREDYLQPGRPQFQVDFTCEPVVVTRPWLKLWSQRVALVKVNATLVFNRDRLEPQKRYVLATPPRTLPGDDYGFPLVGEAISKLLQARAARVGDSVAEQRAFQSGLLVFAYENADVDPPSRDSNRGEIHVIPKWEELRCDP